MGASSDCGGNKPPRERVCVSLEGTGRKASTQGIRGIDRTEKRGRRLLQSVKKRKEKVFSVCAG